jgi:lysophospholipid acyltransferase (LPLAT)-like uncharacterized protein
MSGGRAPWWAGPATALAAFVIGLLARTWRITWVEAEAYEAALAQGQRCIFAFWHARMLPLVWTHRHRAAAVLVSRSRDGELIARTIERFGFVTARGSSHRGGREGASEMLAWAQRGRLLGVTPDGPRGPAEVVKPGTVWLAARSGFPVVPLATASARCWVARSWDGFRVPLPFARVVVEYGTPIQVPRDLDEADGEAWRRRIEDAIRVTTEAARRRAGEIA